MNKNLTIKGYDFVEFYVGSAKMVAYWYAKALGFAITGYLGPETGRRDRCSYFLTQGNIRLVISSLLQPGTNDIASYLVQHGDGVKRWGVLVDDVEASFNFAFEHGAIPVRKPTKLSDDNGFVWEAAIRLYDDTELLFSNYDNYKGIFRPGFSEYKRPMSYACEAPKLYAIDHIVGNVRENEMNLWANYFNTVMDFETFIDFGPGDISTKYSALLSKVVRSKNNRIKNPINEPYVGVRKSQIQEYIEEFHGSGVQHIAIATEDIIACIKALRANGVEFLSVPDTYYDALRKRNKELNLGVTENIDELQAQGILCDTEGEGYLLQLFTKPIGDRPTFFFEFIQRRRGAMGFGQGNFQALFESIEADQALRGNLV